MQTELHNKVCRMKRSGYLVLLLTFGTIILSATSVYAQQQGDAQNSLLPEIDPQDIEIRSEFKARFPGLRRQPILGFNPEPSIYQVASDRQPFMETQEEVVANLPITDLSRPSAPEYEALEYSNEKRLFGRLGVGSFVSPEAEVWGINRFSEKSYVSGSLDYHSSSGHLDKENSSFRFFNADGEIATKVNQNTSIKFSAGTDNSFNRLYELESSGGQIPTGPRKQYTGFNTGLSLSSYKNSVAGLDAEVNYRWFDMNMESGSIGGTATESVFNASINKDWTGSRLHETFVLHASGKGGSYELSSQNGSQNWMTLHAGGRYERLLDYSTQITADASLVYTSNSFEDKIYPGFTLKAKHWIHDNLTLSGSLSGNPRLHTIEQLHQLNRFLNHQTQLRHTYKVDVDGRLNFEYFSGSSIHAKVSYMQAQNYAYFARSVLTNFTGTQRGYYTLNFRDANRLKGEAGVTHQLVPHRLWINAKAYVQNPRFSNGDDIPFEETWGVNSGFSVKVIDKLKIEAWADYISERKTADLDGSSPVSESQTLKGFLLLGGQIDVGITDRIGVYAKMLNLLSQEYEIWSGYEERPFQAYAGITVKLN